MERNKLGINDNIKQTSPHVLCAQAVGCALYMHNLSSFSHLYVKYSFTSLYRRENCSLAKVTYSGGGRLPSREKFLLLSLSCFEIWGVPFGLLGLFPFAYREVPTSFLVPQKSLLPYHREPTILYHTGK